MKPTHEIYTKQPRHFCLPSAESPSCRAICWPPPIILLISPVTPSDDHHHTAAGRGSLQEGPEEVADRTGPVDRTDLVVVRHIDPDPDPEEDTGLEVVHRIGPVPEEGIDLEEHHIDPGEEHRIDLEAAVHSPVEVGHHTVRLVERHSHRVLDG